MENQAMLGGGVQSNIYECTDWQPQASYENSHENMINIRQMLNQSVDVTLTGAKSTGYKLANHSLAKQDDSVSDLSFIKK